MNTRLPTPAGERTGILLMVFTTLIWGATFVTIRDLVASMPPLVLVFMRFGVAGLLYLPIVALRRRRLNRASIEGGIVTGAFMTGGFLFQAIGLESTSAGSSAFLTCAATLFAGFLAWPILHQRPQPVLVGGIAIALTGSALLTLHGGLRVGVGEAWTLLGAMCYAVQVVMVARYIERADSVVMVAVQSLTIALILLPFAGGTPAAAAAIPPGGWLRIGFLILGASMLAPLGQVLAQRDLPPGRIGLLFALEPLFALMFAVSVGGEHFRTRWWIGAALILLSVVLVEGDALRRERRAELSASPPA